MVWKRKRRRRSEEEKGRSEEGRKKARSEWSVSSGKRRKKFLLLSLVMVILFQACEGWQGKGGRSSPKPCFPRPFSLSPTRMFGEPCHLSHIQDEDRDFSRETTPEERMSQRINPIPFLFGPFIQRGIRGIQGLEQIFLLSPSPSALKLCLKIFLHLFTTR